MDYTPEKIGQLIARLRAKASQEIVSDQENFNADEWSGGNFDDAFDLGCQDGEVRFARQLLEELEGKL